MEFCVARERGSDNRNDEVVTPTPERTRPRSAVARRRYRAALALGTIIAALSLTVAGGAGAAGGASDAAAAALDDAAARARGARSAGASDADVLAALEASARRVERAAASFRAPSSAAAAAARAALAAASRRASEVAQAAARKQRAATEAVMATQSAGRRLTAPLVRAYEEAAALAALAGAHAGSAAAAARADYGGRAARYLPLAGACADSGPVGEGILRGGSTTVTPKTYSYVVCAFANVTQREVGAAAWAAAEAAAKAGSGGGSGAGVVGELAVAPDGAVASPPPAPPARDPPPQLVGLFRGWVAHRDLAAHFAAGLSRLGRDPLPASPDVLVSADALPRGPDGEPEPAALFYEGVEPCASGAMRARRRTWVLLTCGDAIGTGGGGGGGTYGGGGGGGGVDLGDATSIDAAAPWGFRALATGRGWGPRGGSNDTAGAVDGGGGGGPSLVERMLRAAHPSVPARFVPRRLNARAAGGGPLRVLHVAEDGLCNTIAWAAAAAACDRAAAGGARRLASAAAAHAAPEAEDL